MKTDSHGSSEVTATINNDTGVITGQLKDGRQITR